MVDQSTIKRKRFKRRKNTRNVKDSSVGLSSSDKGSGFKQDELKEADLSYLDKSLELDSKGRVPIPTEIDTFGLSRIIRKDLNELKETVDNVADELGITIVDEFQPLRNELIDNICLEYAIDHKLVDKTKQDIRKRPPVVTIMGHVDHGKTTLLDAFRRSDLCSQEYGAITQSTAAFSFTTEKGHFITFIDTPGHEVFDGMRLRGAKATDIVILVISAIEGVQKQTREVLGLIMKFDLPMVVALNKTDSEISDPDQVILDLIAEGVELDEVGGDVPSARISALNQTGLDQLEERITDLAESLDLKDDYIWDAQWLIVESHLDDTTAQITASVVVKKGTLNVEDAFICGNTDGRIRYIYDDNGQQIKQLFPGQSGRVSGFKEIPDPGFPLYKVQDVNQAKYLVTLRQKRQEVINSRSKSIEHVNK